MGFVWPRRWRGFISNIGGRSLAPGPAPHPPWSPTRLEVQRLDQGLPRGRAAGPRWLTIKQEAAFGSKPHGVGSRAQDKNIQLERQAPN